MGPSWPHIILFCERMNVMKNANDFENSKYNSLTKSETKLIEKVIDKIISNHENDEWWVIDTAIKTHVYYALSLRLQDESFKEHQARLLEEEKERERIEAEEAEKEQAENEQAEKESDEIINDILSEIE